VGIAVAVAVAIGLIAGHELPDYDATFALIWGREIFHGHAPDYSLPYRPAGHPLTTFVGLVGAPLGRDGAAEFLRWVALLGAGAFVASIFRFGQVLFGTIAGAAAAVLVATRSPLWGFSELGFMDAWAAAFVVWAALLELRSPRRGPPVFVLLGLAGLLRPEVWLFAAAYWLWIASGSLSRAVRLLPLAALGPLAWIAWDLATAQTFLGSVGTAEGLPVATSSGGHGISRAPRALVRDIGGFMRPPEVIAAVAGFALVCWANWRRAAMPVVLIVLNVVAFAIVAERGGPIEQRYLLVAAGMLLVFAGYALAQAVPAAVRDPQPAANPHGSLHSPPGPADPRRARIIRLAGALLAVACIAYVPIDIRRITDLRDQVRVSDEVYSDLRTVVEAPATRCRLAGHVHVDDVRLRPSVAYWGAVPLERIDTEPGGSGTLVALDPVARELSSRSLPADPHAQPKRPPLWRLDGACARQ
jgi:hypothetical protein